MKVIILILMKIEHNIVLSNFIMMLQSLDLEPNLTLNNNIKVNAAITLQGLLRRNFSNLSA